MLFGCGSGVGSGAGCGCSSSPSIVMVMVFGVMSSCPSPSTLMPLFVMLISIFFILLRFYALLPIASTHIASIAYVVYVIVLPKSGLMVYMYGYTEGSGARM